MTTDILQQPTQKPSFSLNRFLLGLVFASIDVYAVGASAYLLLRLITGQRLWVVPLLDNLLHWGLLLSFPLVIFVLVLHRWRRAVMAAVPALGFLILYGALFLPATPTARACTNCHPIRVMTYNLYGTGNPDYAPQMTILRESGADIIAVQELSAGAAAAIQSDLTDLYPFQVLYPYGIQGTGILSKYPISDPEAFQLTPNALYYTRAQIDLDGVPVTVISAHPPPPNTTREAGYYSRGTPELTVLLPTLDTDQPILFLGDFNAVDQSTDYQMIIDAGFHDAFRTSGWGFGSTWPNRISNFDTFPPLIRIDYVFYTDHFHAVRSWVGPTDFSDHKPVLADILYAP